ncbi:MAG TPA: glycine cleavage system aminomethyltransferase GcvT [Candidatus Korarchaeota archaeon]|nr:glycine cleavage system aminomethyltransferase GcvT [Candidatus Korarchaeota archaeon]
MRRLPLDHLHRELGAKFFQFAGWEMPMKYTNSLKEVLAVRNSVGVFDISHMGRFMLQGPDALEFLQRATSNNMRISNGRTRYTLTLNESGGIKDDNVAFKLSDDKILFVVNAANREKIWSWFRELLSRWNLDVRMKDETLKTVMLAVQGPEARELVHKVLGTTFDLRKFRVTEVTHEGRKYVVSTTGYTGEDGYEITIWDIEWAEKILRSLLEEGASLCGLVARDILRLEAGLVLYGNDIDEKTNPLEARLDFAVDLNKEYFVGKESLEKAIERGISRLRVGLLSETRNAPRRGDALYKNGEMVGTVTSGTFSPTVGKGIGMGYISPTLAEVGEELTVRGVKEFKVKVSKMPFYDESKYGWRRVT